MRILDGRVPAVSRPVRIMSSSTLVMLWGIGLQSSGVGAMSVKDWALRGFRLKGILALSPYNKPSGPNPKPL